MRCALVLASALALGCSQVEQEEPSSRSGDFDEKRDPVVSETSNALVLTGEWRVAGVDGEAIEGPVGVALSIDAERIVLAPCASLHWSYRLEGARLSLTRLPPDDDGLICRIPEITAQIGDAIGSATEARRTPQNGMELSGNGRSVTLFSQ